MRGSPVNLLAHVGKGEMNVNMVTCGGQATIPMVYAVKRASKRHARSSVELTTKSSVCVEA